MVAAVTFKTTKVAAGKVNHAVKARNYILEHNQFAVDPGGKIYVYRDGAYKTNGEAFIKLAALDYMRMEGAEGQWRSALGSEAREYIRLSSRQLMPQPPADTVNVKNGLLHLPTKTLCPHTPDHLSVVQIPVIFDPTATCDAWQMFAEQVFPADSVQIAFELPALLMTPYTSLQLALLLLGAGGNGKSPYLNALSAFIGKANISNMSLHRLESDRFSAANLQGKLANICPDLPSEHLAGTSVFKAIVGGDPISAEHKFRDGFDFTPFAKLVFSANHPPRSNDNSEGIFRRWAVVPFTRTFSPDAAGYVPKDRLDAMLADPGELSGALNRAVDLWRGVTGHGLTRSPSMVEAWEQLRSATDPLAVWLDRATVQGSSLFVPQGDLIAAYGAECDRAGRPQMAKQAFRRALKRYRAAADEAQRTIGGHRQWCYTGIGLRASGVD
jgi:putative DNA primase/helicase